MHPVIQSAVAAQHVKDMLDQAAQDGRVREARRARTSRRWWQSPFRAASPRAASPGAASPGVASSSAASSRVVSPRWSRQALPPSRGWLSSRVVSPRWSRPRWSRQALPRPGLPRPGCCRGCPVPGASPACLAAGCLVRGGLVPGRAAGSRAHPVLHRLGICGFEVSSGLLSFCAGPGGPGGGFAVGAWLVSQPCPSAGETVAEGRWLGGGFPYFRPGSASAMTAAEALPEAPRRDRGALYPRGGSAAVI